jgi:hypothetical protein
MWIELESERSLLRQIVLVVVSRSRARRKAEDDDQNEDENEDEDERSSVSERCLFRGLSWKFWKAEPQTLDSCPFPPTLG